jgi:hypothetical protein
MATHTRLAAVAVPPGIDPANMLIRTASSVVKKTVP